VGLFEGEKERLYAMLVNRDYTKPVQFSVELNRRRESMWLVEDAFTENAVEMKDGMGSVSLAAGSGVLLRLGSSPPRREQSGAP